MKRYRVFTGWICRVLCLAMLLSAVSVPGMASVVMKGSGDYYLRPAAGTVVQVAVSPDHVAVLRTDGTVRATGANEWGQCEVSGWADVAKIWVCKGATVGLTKSGKVLSTIANLYQWTNVVDIGLYRCETPQLVIIGALMADGTVKNTAMSGVGMAYPFGGGVCDVSGWRDITQLVVGRGYYGLKADGTVVEALIPSLEEPASPTSQWTDVSRLVLLGQDLFGITKTGSVYSRLVPYGSEEWTKVVKLIRQDPQAPLYALTADGRLLSAGEGAVAVGNLSGLRDVAAAAGRLAALKENGTITILPEPANFPWALKNSLKNIQTMVCTPEGLLVGLKADGTVVALNLADGKADEAVSAWKTVDTLYAGGFVVGLLEDGSLVCSDPELDMAPLTANVADTRPREDMPQTLAAGLFYSVYARPNGTVAAAGENNQGSTNVSAWTDIIAVSAYNHTVGVKTNGTVVATGLNGSGQCNVSSWRNVVQVAAGGINTVGLTTAGTVYVAGSNEFGQYGLKTATGIVQVAAGSDTVYAVTDKGVVISAGSNEYGQKDVGTWSNIIAVSAGAGHVVGLRTDGTVVATGNNDCGQCDVSAWTDIVAIAASTTHTLGLKANGTVVVAGSNAYGQANVSAWKNVVAISAGMQHSLALTQDGKILTAGSNALGQRDLKP